MRRKTNNFFLFLSILAVIAVSGCISNLGFGGPSQQTVEAPSDVMSFLDDTVIPNPPILTGDTFTTYFTIKNLDELEDAGYVELELYDWGMCEPSSCKPSKEKDGIGWETITGNKISYRAFFEDIFPQDLQQVECQFRAPSPERIGGMNANCPIRYKLNYDFRGITTADLNLISNKKFQEVYRAGQVPSVSSLQTKSRGPIKVDFSFGVNQPVKTSTKDNIVKIPMYIRVENKGSGNVKIDGVSYVLSLTIVVPSELIPNKDCESFKCDWLVGREYGSKEGGTYDPSKCVLILEEGKAITEEMFVKGKTQSFRCELTSPDESVVPEQRTYSIQGIAKYTYQIDNDFNVAIKPMSFR